MLTMFNMETSIHKRRRILFHFLLGVGLPSLLLGYLAFRGIRNDIALLEEERLREHNAFSEKIIKSTNDEISAVEQALDNLLARQSGRLDSQYRGSVRSLKKNHPILEEIFFFEANEEIQLPFAKILFLPAETVKSHSTQKLPSTFLTGQQYEFQENRHEEALAKYRQAFAQAFNPQAKAEVLTAIARVQKKIGLFAAAGESYKKIARDYGDLQAVNGSPAGLIARLELGDLLLTTGDPDNAAETLFHLYEDLIDGKWPLSQPQYEFLVRQAEDSIRKIISQDKVPESYRNTLNRLRIKENEHRGRTERLLTFRESAAPNLRAQVLRMTEDPHNEARRFTLDIAEYSYLVFFYS
jgi:tetratricopeptide (TPR) repeat protein